MMNLPFGFDWRAACPELLITHGIKRVSLVDLEARARAHADRRSLPPDRPRTRAQVGSPIVQCASPWKSNCATWVKSAVGATDHPQVATLGLSDHPFDPPSTNGNGGNDGNSIPIGTNTTPFFAGKTSALATIDFRVPPLRQPPPPPPPHPAPPRNTVPTQVADTCVSMQHTHHNFLHRVVAGRDMQARAAAHRVHVFSGRSTP